MTRLEWSPFMTYHVDVQDFMDRCKDGDVWQLHNAIILAYNQGRLDARESFNRGVSDRLKELEDSSRDHQRKLELLRENIR